MKADGAMGCVVHCYIVLILHLITVSHYLSYIHDHVHTVSNIMDGLNFHTCYC